MAIFHSIIAFALALTVLAKTTDPSIPPEDQIDPYADPQNDPYNPMGYIATNWLTGLSTGPYCLFFFFLFPVDNVF